MLLDHAALTAQLTAPFPQFTGEEAMALAAALDINRAADAALVLTVVKQAARHQRTDWLTPIVPLAQALRTTYTQYLGAVRPCMPPAAWADALSVAITVQSPALFDQLLAAEPDAAWRKTWVADGFKLSIASGNAVIAEHLVAHHGERLWSLSDIDAAARHNMAGLLATLRHRPPTSALILALDNAAREAVQVLIPQVEIKTSDVRDVVEATLTMAQQYREPDLALAVLKRIPSERLVAAYPADRPDTWKPHNAGRQKVVQLDQLAVQAALPAPMCAAWLALGATYLPRPELPHLQAIVLAHDRRTALQANPAAALSRPRRRS